MEYVAGGELFHYVDERKGLAEDEAVLIFRQIVSALLYCHRLLICHRDLKPENILLDTRTLTVKLIDFGMAALQPEGKLLSTPCGSPHYAAPEVVSSRPYDGTQADVWSCGVILYVMLTGTTPYNYPEGGDIRCLFKDIAVANYYMPRDLSFEAQDLIKRIFVPDPKKRITMDEVWDHPLLHKYDRELGWEGEYGKKEFAVGEPPRLDRWKVNRIQDIDREILRNMRTLWHSEPEQNLIQKLLNDEYNQEKLFYAALIKHREENLENYLGDADDMSCSASDYHHSKPVKPADMPSLPTKAQRSQSQYSIMNDEHLRPSHSFVGPPPSESSYDPYRASRNPIVNAQGEYLNVTVHRNSTTSTHKGSMGRRLRHHSTRIETLKHEHRRKSTTVSSSSLPRSGRSRSSLPRSSLSRHSMSLPSSPPVIATMRPSDVHRRGVSFGHIRRISTASALTSQLSSTAASTPVTPSLPVHLRERHARLIAQESKATNSSPTAPADQPIRSRKERMAATQSRGPQTKARKIETPGFRMRSDIRKHSAELEKACEEAFYRDSTGSSVTVRTSATDGPSPCDTPPSSVAAQTPGLSNFTDIKAHPRPLPEPPTDTPNSYITRTLEETRSKLAAYKENGEFNTTKFDEVMKMLDTIMPASGSSPERRIASAPATGNQMDHGGALPIISEEGSDQRSSRDGANWHRSVTAPISKTRKPEDKTIRVVPLSSPGTIAPLNVRKRGSHTKLKEDTQRRVSKEQEDGTKPKQQGPDSSTLISIDEDSAFSTPAAVRKKRSGWFGRSKKHDVQELGDDSALPIDEETSRRKSAVLMKASPRVRATEAEAFALAQLGDLPLRKNRFADGKKGLSRWLGKLGKEKGVGDTTMTTEAGECESCVMLVVDTDHVHRNHDADEPIPGFLIFLGVASALK